MGRKADEPLVRIVDVEILDVRREMLGELLDESTDYGELEMVREGFPDLAPSEFIRRYFTDAQGITENDTVTRIEWRYLDGEL